VIATGLVTLADVVAVTVAARGVTVMATGELTV